MISNADVPHPALADSWPLTGGRQLLLNWSDGVSRLHVLIVPIDPLRRQPSGIAKFQMNVLPLLNSSLLNITNRPSSLTDSFNDQAEPAARWLKSPPAPPAPGELES
jgi:hypothetical protein